MGRRAGSLAGMSRADQDVPGGGDLPGDVDATLRASRALLGLVARSLAPALEHVSLPQFRVLSILAVRGPLRSGVLAERLGVHPSTFSRNADRLVAGGWVRRTVDPESRLSILIELTDAGRALVDEVTDRRRGDLAAVLSTLAAGERAAVAEALGTFAAAAGEPGPEDLGPLGM